VLLGTGTLLPPLMQEQLGYPVLTTGLVLAPRGMGAMVAALIVGRLVMRVNPRYLIIIGLLINAAALYLLSGATPAVTPWFYIWIGAVQGGGLGLTFVPLTTVTFSSLSAHLRNEATPVFNLVKNIGSSIGISIVYTLMTRHVQINHAMLGEHLTPFSHPMQQFLQTMPMPQPTALALLNAERSEEHTSELQSRFDLVCRLLLEKKKKTN